MTWTREQKLAALLRLPWTIRTEHNRDEGYWVGRVAEIPSALATGDSPKELERELWESLAASLEVYLDHDDPIPLPPGVARLPWDEPAPSTRPTAVMATYERGEVWDRDPTASADRLIERDAEAAFSE